MKGNICRLLLVSINDDDDKKAELLELSSSGELLSADSLNVKFDDVDDADFVGY